MISEMPCGCATKPITNKMDIRRKLKGEHILFFDDSRCVEHEDGTGVSGFLIPHEGKYFSHVYIENGDEIEELEGTLNLKQAQESLNHYLGHDFELSYGKALLEREGDSFTIVCGGDA
ncbi:hypothetical protein IMZ31_20095 (plasmid) [Pontibacillus sp. ALD_SL1]|uniref:hypothetical protein n=1 Tax=Pontibacillus sp. ALD_SL1 TaxID=2777185 RepID=UPI001A97746C|nr:hypothetical protein [Pontibacillus sp. ALD_SL1]QST02854.1 hypothetical protein IMZ31_20095 [Pontibacillus sp. ALD_SL1]